MAAVAEQGPGQGFCLTWDLAGEKEQAVRALLLGRAEGSRHAWPGQRRPFGNSAVQGLELQASPASTLVTAVGNVCPLSLKTEVQAKARRQLDAERTGLSVGRSRTAVQTLSSSIVSDTRFPSEPPLPFMMGMMGQPCSGTGSWPICTISRY